MRYYCSMTKAKKFKTDLTKLNEMILKSGRKKCWVAEQLGVHYTTISGWLSGKREMSYMAAKLIAQVLECEIEDIELKAA